MSQHGAKTASRPLDRLALRVCCFSARLFLALWHSDAHSTGRGRPVRVGNATLLLLERRTLARRDRALRVRVGGTIALEELMLLPAAEAEGARLSAAGPRRWAARRRAPVLSYAGKDVSRPLRWACPAPPPGEGDVLAAHRAGPRSGAELCILAERAALPAAQRAASGWAAHPPKPQAVGSRCSSGTAPRHRRAEIARRAPGQRTPFSRGRIRALALAPAKQGRYLSSPFCWRCSICFCVRFCRSCSR